MIMESYPVLLFVDATVRPAGISRTGRLCRSYLDAFSRSHPEYRITRIQPDKMNLSPKHLPVLEEETALLAAGRTDHPMFEAARQFAAADRILIGAPYWDFSFPAVLKIYLERICVSGITFTYKQDRPVGLCRARRLDYLTTCGGFVTGFDLGSVYITKMCSTLLGIPDCRSLVVDKLDTMDADIETIMQEGCRRAAELATSETVQ